MRPSLLAAIAVALFVAGSASLITRPAENHVTSPHVGLPVATIGDIFSRL